MILWSANPTLWLVSFTSFSQRLLHKAKSWKTQDAVLVTKSGENLNLIWFSDPQPKSCMWFHLLSFLHDHLINPKAKKHKISFLVTKSGENWIRYTFWTATPKLWVVSFTIFLHDHFMKPKIEKHKIPFLVTKSG